jgi:protein required for attachment to host cells
MPADIIEYDQAVREGRQIVAQIDDVTKRGQLRLGELAAKVETKYKDRTLAKFAAEINIAACTLARYRDVYKAWANICAPGRQSCSYAVLRELATHPARETIVRNNPNLTKRAARDLMHKLKGAEEEHRQEEQENDWLKDNRRWFRALCTRALEVSRMVEVALNLTPEKQGELVQVVEPLMLGELRMYGRMLVELANHLERLFEAEEAAEQPEPEDVEVSAPIERAQPEATAQAAE